MSTKLTQERLKELLHYDPETGEFTWLVNKARARAGTTAGTAHNCGYVTLKIDGIKYLRHRSVWLYVYGVWPEHEIDHIDGDRGNDRLANLRSCTSAENKQNLALRPRSGPGMPGAIRTDVGWVSRIRAYRKVHYIGTFPTPEEAHQAYLKAKARLHTFQPTPRATSQATI